MADIAAVTKAVIPAAGLGTRFLPAAKAIPKEMLPVIDTPTIQLVVEEAVAAGLHDVLVVTRRGKSAIEDHFDRALELEEALTAKGDDAGLAIVRAATELADMHYVRQDAPKGLGHAVLCAADHVGDEPFAVLLGDDFIDRRDPLLRRMLGGQEALRRQHRGADGGRAKPDLLVWVRGDQADRRGRRRGRHRPGGEARPAGGAVQLDRDRPVYLRPGHLRVLRDTPPGRGGEIQLTDALRTLAVADCAGERRGGGGADGAGARRAIPRPPL